MAWVFGRFEIDRDGSRLLRDGTEVPLERRALELLCYLVEHPGRLISKDELIARVWSANALSEGVLPNTVTKLRKALGQAARDRGPIETVHGRGYRFHAPSAPAKSRTGFESPVSSAPFVGRHVQVAQIDASLAAVASGTGRLVLVSGEAGIGKSRMLDELASRAVARDFAVWRGATYAGGAMPAYWPWVEVVRAVLAEPELRRQLPSDSWAIAALVPELHKPHARSEDAQALRFCLFDELTRWFAACASRRPFLIVIDDLQWADAASIELLDHLARALLRQRVLLAAAVRDDALLDLCAGADNVPALLRLFRSAVHIELRGLSTSEMSELVVALARPQDVCDARSAELLYRITGGNPFFVQQVVQLLVQRGQPLDVASIEGAALPPAVRDVIQQRLAMLVLESRVLLRTASAIGHSFDASLLAHVTGQSLAAVLSALDPARQLGIIDRCDNATQRFELNHPLVCDALYDELSLPQRGEIHALLSRALEAHASASDVRVLGEIARHSLLAAPFDVEAAVRHCCRAAHASREASGFEASAALLTRALERLVAEGCRSELRCEVLYELSLDHFCVGDIAQGCRALVDGAQLASEIGATRWLGRCVSRFAGWLEFGGDADTLRPFVDRALERMDPAEDMYPALLARRAELNPELGAAERNRLYVEAERLAAQSGLPEVMFEVGISRANQRDPTQLEASLAAVAAYRVLEARYPGALRSLHHRLRRSKLELTAYWSALLADDRAAAQLALAECQGAAELCHIPYLRRAIELMTATRALSEGRLDDASAILDRTRESGDLVGGLQSLWQYCSLLLAEATNEAALFAQLAASMDFASLHRLPRRRALSAIAWCAALAGRTGHPDVAQQLLLHMSDAELERMPVLFGDLGLLCSLAEAYAAIGARSRAVALYSKLEPYASLNAVGVAYEYKGSVAHYLGVLAWHIERPDVALRHLEAAIAFNEKLGLQARVTRSRDMLEAFGSKVR